MSDEMFIKRILIPVDGSPPSLMALETAMMIAEKAEASVTVLRIMPRTYGVEEMLLPYADVFPLSGYDSIVGRKIEDLVKGLPPSGERGESEKERMKVKVETQFLRVWADISGAILRLSKKGYDLILMGVGEETVKDPHGLGNLPYEVLGRISLPFLLVKKVSNLSNMLVCVDGSENSVRALIFAVMLAERMGSKITLLNVQKTQRDNTSSETAEERGKQVLSKALESVRREKLNYLLSLDELIVDKRVEFGIPSKKIVEFAEMGNYDLIVLGRRGLGRARRFLLGSVSDAVSRKAKCSVLMVPAKRS